MIKRRKKRETVSDLEELDIFDACLCLQTNFPKANVLPEKTETISFQVVFHGFTGGTQQFIARHDKRRDWSVEAHSFAFFDGFENVKRLRL